MLNVIDEFTHECLAIRVARKLKAIDVIGVLSDLFILRGMPSDIRSDNGPDFVAKAVEEWITAVGARTGRTLTPCGGNTQWQVSHSSRRKRTGACTAPVPNCSSPASTDALNDLVRQRRS